MGNKFESNNKSLEDLKKDLQFMSDADLNRIKGGRKTSSNKWNISLGGLTPQ